MISEKPSALITETDHKYEIFLLKARGMLLIIEQGILCFFQKILIQIFSTLANKYLTEQGQVNILC